MALPPLPPHTPKKIKKAEDRETGEWEEERRETSKLLCLPVIQKHTNAILLLLRKELVSWYFEPSQPQRITSGLKTNFNLSPSYLSLIHI